MSSIGLLSTGDKYGEFMREILNGLLQKDQKKRDFSLKYVYIQAGMDNLVEFCERCAGFDCVILTDDLTDSYHSREAVQKIIQEIGKTAKVIVLSIWEDSWEYPFEGKPVLVESRETIYNKCQKIIKYI